MNKQEFLKAIKKKLKGLPKNEIEERLSFYSEMIEDKKEEGTTEEDAINELGSVDSVASEILNDNEPSLIEKGKKVLNDVKINEAWKIVLIILGFPIWFSLLATVFSVLVSVCASIFAVIVSLYAVCLALVVSAFGTLIMGLVSLFSNNLIQGIAIIGLSLTCFGVSILLFYLTNLLTKSTIILIKKLLKRGNNKWVNQQKFGLLLPVF